MTAKKGPQFQRGEVVRLNSGGPEMTVREEKKGVVVCDWSEGNKTRREAYYVEQLRSAAKEISKLELARRIAFILQEGVRAKGANPSPSTVDGMIETILKQDDAS